MVFQVALTGTQQRWFTLTTARRSTLRMPLPLATHRKQLVLQATRLNLLVPLVTHHNPPALLAARRNPVIVPLNSMSRQSLILATVLSPISQVKFVPFKFSHMCNEL